MRIGTRWPAGADAPAGLSPQLCAAAAQLEHELRLPRSDSPTAAAGPVSGTSNSNVGLAPKWTLTWLEGRAVCTLHEGVGYQLSEAADGSVLRRLLNEGASDGPLSGEPLVAAEAEDEDDDWLR